MILNIFSLSGEKIEKEIFSINFFTTSGEVTILDNHAPLLTTVKPGVITYKSKMNSEIVSEQFVIGAGVVEASEGKISIIVNSLTDSNLEEESILKAKEEAEKLLEKYKNSSDKIDIEKFLEAEESMMRAVAQMKLFQSTKK